MRSRRAPVLCGCGRWFAPPSQRGPAPLRCAECKAARKRAQVRRATADRRRRMRVARPAPAAAVPPSERALCGCGRDYATVPLEEAHRCPRPLL